MMPIVMMIDTPFPMPLSVIFSPSHIRIIVPQVRMMTEKNTNAERLPLTSGWPGSAAGRPRRSGCVMAIAVMAP